MSEKYTKEQLWKLFEKLPEELKDAIFAEKTADDIYDICKRNEVEEKKIPEVARLTGNVLLGILPINELQGSLEKEIGLEQEVAKKVFYQISRFVFFPIKKQLAEIHNLEITSVDEEGSALSEEKESSVSMQRDAYRESIE